MITITVLCMIAVFGFAEEASGIRLNVDAVEAAVGTKGKLTITFLNPADAKGAVYEWTSSDETVVSVLNGAYTCLNEGNATITCVATLTDGRMMSATVNIKVYIPVKTLKLDSPKEIKLRKGTSYTLTWVFEPANATNQEIEWSSDHPEIAEINADGVVTANSPGKAVVTGISKDGKKRVQQTVIVPSLYAEETDVIVSELSGKGVKIFYYGNNWDENVTIKQKAKMFDYTLERDKDVVTLHLTTTSVGSDTLTITDKTDPKNAVVLNIETTLESLPYNQYILITGIKEYSSYFSVSFVNNTNVEIADPVFRVTSKNRFGEIEYENNNNLSSILEDKRYYYFTMVLKPRQKKNAYLVSGAHRDIYHEFALDSFYLMDGTNVDIPDSQHYWYSSENKGYQEKPITEVNIQYPENEIVEKADQFVMGWESIKIPEDYAPRYHYHHGGVYLYEIIPGGLAEQAGLKKYDLIFAVDGEKWVDNPYIFTYAKAKLADHQSVVFSVERYGQEETLEITVSR